MEEYPPVTVLRLGHRPARDERMTTHVGLTARALGADRLVIDGNGADCKGSIDDVTDRFGGAFTVEITDAAGRLLRTWDGAIVHLTMYGLPIQTVMDELRSTVATTDTPLLVVVGAEKVPFDVYETADWNVAVTNQPHSEVASLAVFLDRFFEGQELDQAPTDGEVRVVPLAAGKRMIPVEEESSERSNRGD